VNKFYIGTLYPDKPGQLGGIEETQMLSVAMPQQGTDAGGSGYAETLDFEYGGADVVSAPQTHRRYEFNWAGSDVDTATGISQIKRIANGEFGTGLIYFADPYNYTTNLLPPAWASPSLIRNGWRSIYDTKPTGYDPISAANDTNQPLASPVFSIVNDAGEPPTDARSICVLPIPPTHVLHLGFSATATGDAVIRVRPITHSNTYDTPVDLTLLDWAGSTRMNTTFDGSDYKAVEVYFTRTAETASTLTVTSGMAWLLKTGESQSVSNFISGEGNTGCKFETRALEENYTFVDMGRRRRIKGLSATLIEVGTSARYA
jgi:hypothetical protein